MGQIGFQAVYVSVAGMDADRLSLANGRTKAKVGGKMPDRDPFDGYRRLQPPDGGERGRNAGLCHRCATHGLRRCRKWPWGNAGIAKVVELAIHVISSIIACMANFRKLSPQAKKALILATDAPVQVTALVELSAGYDAETDLPLKALDATLQGWSTHSRIVTLKLPSNRLGNLAETRGVTYVELGENLANPSDPPN